MPRIATWKSLRVKRGPKTGLAISPGCINSGNQKPGPHAQIEAADEVGADALVGTGFAKATTRGQEEETPVISGDPGWQICPDEERWRGRGMSHAEMAPRAIV